MSEGRRVTVEGLDIHYREVGEGPPLLLIHGWPTSAELWRNIMPSLSQQRRVIAIDLPGFGRSDKPTDASYSFRFFDRILTGFLEALDIDDVGLVVHDLGGPVGLHWAVNNTSRVRELAVLNTLVFADLHFAVMAFVAAATLPLVRNVITHPRAIVAAMRFGVHNKTVITTEVGRLYADPFAEKSARRALAKAGRGLHPKGLKTIEDGLPKLAIPVRLIYGAHDRILPDIARTMQRLQAIWPEAELTCLPDAGHFLQEDAPSDVARLLEGWLVASDST